MSDQNTSQPLQVFNSELLDFLQASPTPYHAVEQMAERLIAAGFVQLFEGDSWQLAQNNGYFVTRNDSSIVAFTTGAGNYAEQGLKMVGAHTDSPCLKVKPKPELHKKGYFQLGVEVYGGVLLNPWFDRDLSLAGRVTGEDEQGQLVHRLIDFKRPIAVIPSLAIHLDRQANDKRTVNKQTDIPPILLQTKALAGDDKKVEFREFLLNFMAEQPAKAGEPALKSVLDYELCFYDTQPPALVGYNQEFIASARLDNLLSCFVGLKSLIESDGSQPALLVCNDHEEVGSVSASGAQGPFLKSVLERICGDTESLLRALHHSSMISADNAHGVHPNFASVHDENHGPLLNQGPVIKINANQRYATNSETSGSFRQICESINVPVQAFVTRTDMGCGSTIGPITAAELGVKTLDVGVPTFAMHSIRELAGSEDAYNLYRVIEQFYKG
ncbi:MAG: M18 family aminopeptidase [Pseudomonadales bacterium]|nr:M18 family aminopeptidase [Pseudomonadales bacterium]